MGPSYALHGVRTLDKFIVYKDQDKAVSDYANCHQGK